jgi:CDP-diacylglycerol--serine O-phosphatidyltransferase
VFIVLAAVFDFLDGFAARLLKAYSKIGAELDSLADVVSFGMAPGCIVYIYLEQYPIHLPYALPFIAFLLPIFSALRLAKFNIDTRQTTSFLGLPVPANALFWSSFIPSVQPFTVLHPLFFLVLILVLLVTFCLLLVSELPMFSLKFKDFRWKGNEWPYSLLIISLLLIVVFYLLGYFLFGISLIVIAFIFMSLIKSKTLKI